jgi:peptidoglycan/xylan/chitin deacetylase (PgdA/CDA1 family)
VSDRPRRGWLVGVVFGTFTLLGLLGYAFWKALPPIGIAPKAAHAGARPFPGPPMLPSVITQPTLAGVRVGVLVEPENVRVTPEGVYDEGIAFWKQWIREAGGTLVGLGDADVIVAPHAACLGPVQRRLVAAHLAKGKGLLTTGLFGAYDGVCAPLADTLLISLTGVGRGGIRHAPRKGGNAHYAVVLGESVLGANVPPGARIEFGPAGQLAFKHTSRELLYCDYERHPLSAGDAYFDAVAVRALVGTGRVAAFGFSPLELSGDWSRTGGRAIFMNGVRWAAGRPIYQLAPWPDGHKAAAVMAEDVEADYVNARDALDALEPYGLPGTAFIVGELAEADRETTRRLVAAMEIGSHSQRHLPMDTLSDTAQASELEHSKRVAEQLAGRPVRGFRPPEERYNHTTLQTWADLGGTYVFANNDLRSAAPEVIPMLPDSLVLLGRVSEDDFEILSRDSIRNRNDMSKRIVSQVGESIAYRGLYMFSYHSHMFSQKQLLPVLEALAQKLKDSPEVWTTTAGEVAAWWRSRAHVDLTPSSNGGSVTLHNRGKTTLEGAVLIIDAPRGKRQSVRLPALPAGASLTVDDNGQVMVLPRPSVPGERKP